MRDGSGSSALFPGSLPAVSTDGSVVVGATVAGEVAVSRGGAVSRFSAGGTITGLACDGSTVYYGALDPPSAAVALRAAGLDGSRGRTIVGAAAASRAVTFGDLLLAPDGGELVYAEHGDDGYSRMFAVAAGGGVPVSLCVRRDCYPLRWAADGQSVLFIEGNAFQGDATALMRVAPSGQSRRLLVDGAGR
jgi:hypothetical protein